jgi:AraC-like DNA-binding protein/mannose-6-phosphate isomerase-like protein (cupin superfamily)
MRHIQAFTMVIVLEGRMFSEELNRILHEHNSVERQQYATKGNNFNYMNLDFADIEVPQMPEWSFFENGSIAITKNNRFSYVPEHTHSFIEMNYMYSGRCTQYINDELVELHPGSLIMLDKDVAHRISYTDEDDILVNILIQENADIASMFTMIPESLNVISQLISDAGNTAMHHNNLIVFDLAGHSVATNLIEALIELGLESFPSEQRNQAMKLMLSALIIELKALISRSVINFSHVESEQIAPILSYMYDNYATVDLRSLAQHFGYNRNYLSNKLKRATGKSFQELLDRYRLSQAQKMMNGTTLTNKEISEEIGYRNVTSLFRLFKKYLNATPDSYRSKNVLL